MQSGRSVAELSRLARTRSEFESASRYVRARTAVVVRCRAADARRFGRDVAARRGTSCRGAAGPPRLLDMALPLRPGGGRGVLLGTGPSPRLVLQRKRAGAGVDNRGVVPPLRRYRVGRPPA